MGIEETRTRIVSVADRLFSRFGFHKTSMDEIAKTSRKAKGSLYYHFSSKEALFREVVTNEIEALKKRLSSIVSNNDYTPGGKLKRYMMVRMEMLNSATNYHETIRADQYGHLDFMDDMKHELDVWEKKQVGTILAEGVNSGEFEIDVNKEVLGAMLIMMAKGLEIPFFLHGRYDEYAPWFNDLSGIILRGLRK